MNLHSIRVLSCTSFCLQLLTVRHTYSSITTGGFRWMVSSPYQYNDDVMFECTCEFALRARGVKVFFFFFEGGEDIPS